MLQIHNDNNVLNYLRSDNAFDNSEALISLCEAGVYKDTFSDEAELISRKSDTIAFNIPICDIASVYLDLSGRKEYTGSDERIIGLIDQYSHTKI